MVNITILIIKINKIIRMDKNKWIGMSLKNQMKIILKYIK